MKTLLKSLRAGLFLGFALAVLLPALSLPSAAATPSSQAEQRLSLDGPGWRLATDPKNAGRDESWFTTPSPEAVATHVPWIIQDAFPGYHGVAWYWRSFTAPENPHPHGRCLLRFWAVDYKADVWLNGQAVGGHEGGETPFTLEVTGVIRPGVSNLIAVRVLNPSNDRIDGIVLRETPARNKVIPYSGGGSYAHGGIVDSVELLLTAPVRVEDLFARPDVKTGLIHVEANLRNASSEAVQVELQLTAAPAASGGTLASEKITRQLPPGDTAVRAQLQVDQPHLWALDDPYLYRVSARVAPADSGELDEQSVRCGFRDFRFEDGYFRLNGHRIYLRCSHTGNHCPVGLQLPPDPDFLRRDLLNVKVMGFNAIRFIAGVATRYQLDLCDELGLMVYQESYAGWVLADSPKMAERFDRSVTEMIRRDRNHPSVVMWGLLNETGDGPVFRHAVATLPIVRALDESRLVMLNSGRFDLPSPSDLSGLELWRRADGNDPNVSFNPLSKPLSAPWATWPPGQLALHPGADGAASVVRWTAPEAAELEVSATFAAIGNQPTTDVHVFQDGQEVFQGWLNLHGGKNSASFTGKVSVAKGGTIEFVVGRGNDSHGGDSTGLRAVLRTAQGAIYDPAADYAAGKNPNGAWSYGVMPDGAKPDAARFSRYAVHETVGKGTDSRPIGSLSNPGSAVWEDVLSDQHPYQRAPHTAGIIQTLRTIGAGRLPLFLSEYGIGSGVDLMRVARHYEQLGKQDLEDARFYRDKLDRFLADWKRWRMSEVFGRPEDFFAASLRKMAGQRWLGLNAMRANTNIVGHSLTGTVDQGMSGEGLFTTFRELKPGTVDAVFDAWAPLRWCLFVEPVNVHRGARVRLEAVLANEDVLSPGVYPATLQVLGPDNQVVWMARTNVTIGPRDAKPEPPLAQLVVGQDAVIDGPPGRYRFVATFERGAAAAGDETEFYVADRAQWPAIETEVVQWGQDTALSQWLDNQGIRHQAFAPERQAGREVVLVSTAPAAPDAAAAFRSLWQHVARGSTAVFLVPGAFKKGDQPLGWLPLTKKGHLAALNGWLYHKDEWARNHPIFAGLPTGMMDYTFYREIIPDLTWAPPEGPMEVISAANNVSIDYSSGLMLSVCPLAKGRFILNTLLVRDNLGNNPVADRLLRNLVAFAGSNQKEPLADLPANFDEQLKACGYE